MLQVFDLSVEKEIISSDLSHSPRMMHWNEYNEKSPLIAVCYDSKDVHVFDIRYVLSSAREVLFTILISS